MDNHATTAVDSRVLETMLPFFSVEYGNAASTAHPYGWKAKEAVEHSRLQIANLVGAESSEVIFTSGATESINCVIKGIARNKPWNAVRIVTCVTEHSAVLDTCAYVESLGAEIVRLLVKSDGTLDLEQLKAALSIETDLVSLMHANNEIGTISPIDEIGAICKDAGARLHVDAAQSFGKLSINFANGLVDFMSVSGHKLYAPKGIGCLFVKRRNPPLRLTPLIHGGGHERGFRSGTLNVPGIVGLGAAAEICSEVMKAESSRITELRDLLLKLLSEAIPDIQINGTMKNRLPGNLNVSFIGIEGQLLLPELRNSVSVSSGSACTSASTRPSYVLAALGVPDNLAQASLRFGIGRFNTEEEIHFAAAAVVNAIHKLRLLTADL